MKEQVKKMHLGSPRLVYTIHLKGAADGITYYYPEEKEPAGQYAWDSIYGAWRTKNAIYLYVSEQQALLIPDNNKNADFEELWTFITAHLDKPRIHRAK